MAMRPSPPVSAPSPAFKAHVAVWGLAGVAAALYLGWMTVLSLDGSTTVVKSDRGEARATSEVYAAMVRLAKDVRALDGRVTTTDEAANGLVTRMAALEERTAVSTAAAPATPAATMTMAARTEAPVNEIKTGAITPRTVPPAAPQPAVVAAPVPGIVLAMPAAPAAAAQPAAVTSPALPLPAAPVKAQVGIQLSSASNLDALRLNWSLLNERHRATLGPLQTRYRQASGKPNAPYQLIAGPIRSPADAARICKELAGTGVTCRATTFAGEAL